MAMKNGYTPKEFAQSVAVEALRFAFMERSSALADAGLPPAELAKARAAIARLHDRLLRESSLDGQFLGD